MAHPEDDQFEHGKDEPLPDEQQVADEETARLRADLIERARDPDPFVSQAALAKLLFAGWLDTLTEEETERLTGQGGGGDWQGEYL